MALDDGIRARLTEPQRQGVAMLPGALPKDHGPLVQPEAREHRRPVRDRGQQLRMEAHRATPVREECLGVEARHAVVVDPEPAGVRERRVGGVGECHPRTR